MASGITSIEMLIALRFNLSVDYNIELPQNKFKTSTAASNKAEASSSFKGFGFFKTLNTTWFNSFLQFGIRANGDN